MELKKIFLVDDHRIFRQGLKKLIEDEQIGQVIDEAGDGKEFLQKIKDPVPDLVIMDISMPKMNGVDATIEVKKQYPELPILALSMHGEEDYYYKMVEAGAKGFLLKDSGINEIERAIESIIEGESYFSNEILRRIIKGINDKNDVSDGLTERELEVLELICQGLTNEEIGDKLHISGQTVKGHRSSLLSKTGCKNAASLVMYAIRNKIVVI